MKHNLLKAWLMLCLLTVGIGAWAEDVTFDLVTSASQISAGDRIIIVNSEGTKAISGISTTSTKYGTLADVTTSNNSITVSSTSEVEIFSVENGSTNGTFSFKGSSNINNYLYWTSGNSLNQNATKDAKTSWTIEISDAGVSTVKNCNDATRVIRFNSDRFACYTTNTGSLIKIFKTGAATSGKITIDASKIEGFSGSYSDRTWTSGGISGKVYAYRAGSSAPYLMQFNNTPYCYNTTAVTGRIKSVKITKGGGNTQNWNVYVSNSPITNDNYTSATALSQNYVAVDENGHTFEVASGNYTYFYIRKSSSMTQISSFEIEYEEAQPVGPAVISDLIKTSSANLFVGDEIADLNTYLNLPNDYEGTVTFSSEQDGTLVTLVEEMLEANAAGTATINVTAAANGNYLETAGTITLNISKKTPVIAWTNGTKSSYIIFNGKDYVFTSSPTAYLTNSGPSAINYSISGDAIIVDGEPAWESAGTYVVTAQTAETDEYNASNVLTYTINVVDPAITMTPASGTVSTENPTVTFTGNGVTIAYMDDEANEGQQNGTTISVDATETSTYYVTIYDDAENEFEHDFDVFVLQSAGLAFSAPTQVVSMDDEPFAALALTNPHDLTVTYSMDITNDLATSIATIDPETGVITLSGKAATTAERKAYVVATTESDGTYAAGEARYELIINKRESNVAWSANEVTIDFDEIENLPTLSNPRSLTITYDSSNKDVATISGEGIVTLLAAGTTTISASIASTTYYEAATYKYTLTVAPRYTVTFNVNGKETEFREETTGAGVTAPIVENVADYTFAGWSSSAVAEETTDAQSFVTITDGKYMPTESTTLYAVYKRVEEVEGGSTDEGEFLIYANVNDTKYYMKGKPVASNTTVNQILSSTTRNDATIFTITKNPGNANQYSIAYDDAGTTKYLTNVSNNLQGSEDVYYFTFSDGRKSGTTKMASQTSGRSIGFRATTYNLFKIFSDGNITESSTEYYDPTLEQISGGNVTYYASAPVTTGTISVSSVGYTTYFTNREFTMPEGLEGYVVTPENETSVILTKAFEGGETVPASTALLVKGAQGDHEYNITNTGATFSGENYLHGKLTAGTVAEVPGASKYYKLLNGTKGLGWYLGAQDGGLFTLGANKAYLALPENVAAKAVSFLLDFADEDDADAIKAVKADSNEVIYNLAGQRINKMQKGINIVNGKKILK